MSLKEQLKQMKEATLERMPQSIIQVFENSIDEIKKNGLKEKALKIGDKVPDVPLTNIVTISLTIPDNLKFFTLIQIYYSNTIYTMLLMIIKWRQVVNY